MTYEEAIAIRKRHIANQPVDRDDLAQANRVIAHQRSMCAAFGNEPAVPVNAASKAVNRAAIALPAPTRAPLPRGCISVAEWLRTLPRSESYRYPSAAADSAANP